VRTCSVLDQLSMFWNVSCKSSTILVDERLSLISRVGSSVPLYSQPRCTYFINSVTRWTSQLAATLTPIKPSSFSSLIRLASAETNDISDAVGSSTQVSLYSGKLPMNGGRLGSWFSQYNQDLCHPLREVFNGRSRKS
jgi:hypothetical protein